MPAARPKHTYGNVVCIESMAQTKSVTQHGRGDESSVQQVGLSILSTPGSFSHSIHMKMLRWHQRGGVEQECGSSHKKNTDCHPDNGICKQQSNHDAYGWKWQLS